MQGEGEKSETERSTDGKTAVELTQEFIENVDHRLDIIERSMWYRWTITIAGIIVFAVVAWIGISDANSASDNANTAAKHANKFATNANNLSKEVAFLLNTVRDQGINTQIQRYKTTLDNCLDQNHNHDSTIKAVMKVTNHAVSAHQISRKQAKSQVAQTIFIIDKLVPVRNCKTLANRTAPLPPGIKAPTH